MPDWKKPVTAGWGATEVCFQPGRIRLWASDPRRALAAGTCAPAASSFLLWGRGGALQGDECPVVLERAGAGLGEPVQGPRQALNPGKVGPCHGAVLLSPGTLKVHVSRFNFLGPRHSSKKEQKATKSLVAALWILSRLPSLGFGGIISRPGRKL